MKEKVFVIGKYKFKMIYHYILINTAKQNKTSIKNLTISSIDQDMKDL